VKQYKVYANPQGNYEAVKQGWSWPAFFFSWIWAMIKKMWGLGIGVLVAFLVLGFIIGAAGAGSGAEVLVNIAGIIVNIVFGINGNQWRESNLPTRGYEHKGTVTAANPEGAVALYMKDNTRQQGAAFGPA